MRENFSMRSGWGGLEYRSSTSTPRRRDAIRELACNIRCSAPPLAPRSQLAGRASRGHVWVPQEATLCVGPVGELGGVIRSTFRELAQLDVQTRAAAVRKALRESATASIAPSDLETHFDAFMLPEPSFHEESIALAGRRLRSTRPTVFFVYYDALPLTHPDFFRLDVEREIHSCATTPRSRAPRMSPSFRARFATSSRPALPDDRSAMPS